MTLSQMCPSLSPFLPPLRYEAELRPMSQLFARFCTVQEAFWYLNMSEVAIIFYDYLLTVHREVELIWFSRWSYTKILFLVIRYTSFICALLNGPIIPISAPFSLALLRYPIQGCFMALLMVCSESVLAIRTWAAWRMNRVVGFILVALMLGYLAIQCILLYEYSVTFSPYNLTGMNSVSNRGYVAGFFTEGIALAVIEFAVLSLMAISAFRTYEFGNSSRLWQVIHIDGVLFYAYLLCLTIVAIVIPLFVTAVSLIRLLSILQTMYSVLAVRVILNVRDVTSQQGLSVELHTTRHDMSRPAVMDSGLRFHPRSDIESDPLDWTESRSAEIHDAHIPWSSDPELCLTIKADEGR